MKENRVYGSKININCDNTKELYDSRAERLNEMECPYTAVLLGDQDSNYAKKWNEFENKFILPKLEVNEKSRVLDIGCGMGRWAEFILPIAESYCGTDFSSGMIEVAKERCGKISGNGEFLNLSFQEFVSNYGENTKFSRVIISGVCMYINDEDLGYCYKKLLDNLEQECVVYLTDTVGVNIRLTLDKCPSQALKTTYDVIYRTTAEYNEYYKVFLDAGFEIVEQEYLPHLNKEQGFSETERWYTILKRK